MRRDRQLGVRHGSRPERASGGLARTVVDGGMGGVLQPTNRVNRPQAGRDGLFFRFDEASICIVISLRCREGSLYVKLRPRSDVLRHAVVAAALCALAFGQADPADVWTFDRLDRLGGHATTIQGNPRLIETPIGKAVRTDGVDDALFVAASARRSEDVHVGSDLPARWRQLRAALVSSAGKQDPRTACCSRSAWSAIAGSWTVSIRARPAARR